MPGARLLPVRALVVLSLIGLAVGCGDDGSEAVADDRAAQVREATIEAGLPEEVADVFALAARGATATFQVTYAGTGGASIIVSQAPPNRRVDVLAGDRIVESSVLRDGIAYRCQRATEDLECDRGASELDASGTFTDEAVAAFTDALTRTDTTLDLTVEQRTIAEVEATCLVTAPRAGTPIDGIGPGVDTLCLSPEGAQLLLDSGGERLVADRYTTDVPDGTFAV